MTDVGHGCIKKGAAGVLLLICFFMWNMDGQYDPWRKCVG